MNSPKITAGSLKKRGDWWWYVYRIDGVEMKHRGRTRAEVQAKRDARVGEARVTAQLADTMTLRQGWDRWFDVRGKRRRPGTRRNYDRAFRAFCDHVGADTPLAAVTRVDVEAFEAAQADEGLRRSTIRSTRAALTPMFRWALASNLIPLDPFADLALPEIDDEIAADPRYLDLDEARLLTKYLVANVTDAHVAAMLMLHGGLRIGEALGLGWAHVDLDAGTIDVRQQATEQPGSPRLITSKLKTKASARTITMSPPLRAVLVEHRAAHPDAVLVCTAKVTRRVGPNMPLAQRTTARQLELACAAAGVEYVNPHGLRHTAGSMVYAATHDLTVVADFLGHADLVLVQRLYVHQVSRPDAGAAIGSLNWGT